MDAQRGYRRLRIPVAIVAVGLAIAATGVPAAAATPFVPCPTVKVAPNPPVPTKSPLPTHAATDVVIGGDRLGGDGLAVPAGALPLPKTISATSWVIADLDTGAVLAACGAHRYGAPASLQKLLLAETVMPKLNPQDVVTVTPEDMNFEQGSSAVGLITGGKYTVETLWLGLLLNSGNDAANVLARLGGGAAGVAGTITAMNEEAHRLGAFDTLAMTPSGLDGPGQVTSAYDLALIARACFNREDFARYAATQTAKIPPQPPKDKHGFQIQNDNKLLFEYPGALGGKTGFTDIARHTYVGAAARDGRRLVVTMLGGEHKPIRMWQQGAALLDWGFSLTVDDPVGRLVAPGEVTPPPSATSSVPAAAPGEVAAAAGGEFTGGALLKGVGALAALFVVGWGVILVLAYRRRRRAED